MMLKARNKINRFKISEIHMNLRHECNWIMIMTFAKRENVFKEIYISENKELFS